MHSYTVILVLQSAFGIGHKLTDLPLFGGRVACAARCCATDPYLPDSFLGDVLFRVARSNFAEAGGRITLLITMSFALVPFP